MEITLRLFLTSSRSFKASIPLNKMPNELKTAILYTSMPKFIWVAEISTRDHFIKDEAIGLLIIDATESNLNALDPLIIAAYPDKMILYEERNPINITLPPFNSYMNNLTSDFNDI